MFWRDFQNAHIENEKILKYSYELSVSDNSRSHNLLNFSVQLHYLVFTVFSRSSPLWTIAWDWSTRQVGALSPASLLLFLKVQPVHAISFPVASPLTHAQLRRQDRWPSQPPYSATAKSLFSTKGQRGYCSAREMSFYGNPLSAVWSAINPLQQVTEGLTVDQNWLHLRTVLGGHEAASTAYI